MIDAVSTLSVQSAALRYTPQSAGDSSAAIGAANQANFVTSRVRVDNLQNVAILEYVSGNGQVVQQYPSQQQIRAFKRAEQLQANQEQQARQQQQQQAARAASFHTGSAPVHEGATRDHGSFTATGGQATPAPTHAAASADAVSTGAVPTATFNINTAAVVAQSATLTAGSSQSILV